MAGGVNTFTSPAPPRADMPPVQSLVLRLLRDEQGQDVIEYVLLTSALGLAAAAAFPALTTAIGEAYERLDTGQQDLWRPPDPGAG